CGACAHAVRNSPSLRRGLRFIFASDPTGKFLICGKRFRLVANALQQRHELSERGFIITDKCEGPPRQKQGPGNVACRRPPFGNMSRRTSCLLSEPRAFLGQPTLELTGIAEEKSRQELAAI